VLALQLVHAAPIDVRLLRNEMPEIRSGAQPHMRRQARALTAWLNAPYLFPACERCAAWRFAWSTYAPLRRPRELAGPASRSFQPSARAREPEHDLSRRQGSAHALAAAICLL